MASLTDRVTETFNGQNPTSTTVSNSRSLGGATLTCNSLAGWPTTTAVHFATYRKDSTGTKVAGSQTDWKGIVSGSSVNSLTRQGGAADGGNGVGDIVEMMPTSSWANDLAKGLENTVNADGTIKAGLTIATPTLTSPTLTSPTSTNPTLNSPTFGGTPATGTLSYIALTNPYKFSVYRNASWNPTLSSFGKMQFDTKEFDTGSNYDAVTNFRFTAPVAGFYWFNSSVGVTGGATAETLDFYKNGVAFKRGTEIVANSGSTQMNISALMSLAANDYVEVFIFGASSTGQTGPEVTYFQGCLMSAT